MSRETVEHKIDIDEYMSATLNIPKVMTAEDLKALTTKANKLFNMVEVKIMDSERAPRSSRMSIDPEKAMGWVIAWDKAKTSEEKVAVERSMGVQNRKSAYSKVYYYRKLYKKELAKK